MVTVSAACAVANDKPIVMPAASATIFFIRYSESLEPAESGSIGWMPESGRALGERDKSVKRHSRDRGECDFRPHHVDRHSSGLRRDAKADALRRRPEEFGNDRADQRQRGVDLQGVENKRQRRRQIKFCQGLAM